MTYQKLLMVVPWFVVYDLSETVNGHPLVCDI